MYELENENSAYTQGCDDCMRYVCEALSTVSHTYLVLTNVCCFITKIITKNLFIIDNPILLSQFVG